MIPTHTKKPTPVVAYIFNGHIDCLDQYQVNAKLTKLTNYDSANTICEKCNHHFDNHARIVTSSGDALVCPGNYIVNNPDFPDDFYPVRAEIFEKTYDTIVHSNSLDDKCCISSGVGSTSSYNYEKQIKDEQKLNAAKILLEYNSDNPKAIKYLESLISEPEVK